jgi:hypothetical protein
MLKDLVIKEVGNKTKLMRFLIKNNAFCIV